MTAPKHTEPYPECPNHREVQHRDGKPPWCKECGWNRGQPAIPPRPVRDEPNRFARGRQ